MKYFEQAKENLKRSNFYKALELFELSLKEDALSEELKVFCCEKIERINEILGKDTTVETLSFLASHYFELKVFNKAESFYGKLFKETKNVSFLKKQYESLLSGGDVALAMEKARAYLDELTRRRLSNEILKFISENTDRFDRYEQCDWNLRAHFLSGNRQGLYEVLKSGVELNSDQQHELFQSALDLTSHDARYWHASLDLNALLWNRLTDSEKPFVLSKKSLIKLILDYWLVSSIDQDDLRSTLSIAERYSLPVLAHEIAKFVGDDELVDKYLMKMPRNALSADSFDFGEDLFSSQEESDLKRIERDINFLIGSGKNAEALKLAYQLEKIDPSHELVKKLIKADVAGNTLKTEDKYQSLIKEIETYSSKFSPQEEVGDQFRGLVKHYDYQFVQENYEDMIVGFNLLNLPSVSLELLKKVDDKKLSDKEKINIHYLKIETLLMNENYYEARDLAEDVLTEVPLVKEERLSFQYLRAECYWRLQKYGVAKKLFADIESRNPGYRLTSQRLRSIEEN